MATVVLPQLPGIAILRARDNVRIGGAATSAQVSRGTARFCRDVAGLKKNRGFFIKKLDGLWTPPAESCRRERRKMSFQADPATSDLLTEDTDRQEEEEDDETCELVSRVNIALGVGENAFQGYLVQAIKNNNGASILFLTDVHGFEDGDTRDFAYRLACFGYNVLVPDLFRGNPWSKERPKNEYEDWRGTHPPERTATDIDVASKWLASELDGVSLGVIGFCYGGGKLVETLARDTNNLFSAAVFCYGTRFDVSLVSQIKIPLLMIVGDSDDLCTVSTVREMERTAKEGSQLKIYSGHGHAFVHHPQTFEDDQASEDAFTEIRHWFHERLLTQSE